MTSEPKQNNNDSLAAKLAKVLAAEDFISDSPDDLKPNPHIAASHAFKACYLGEQQQ